MERILEGKFSLITGSGRGIGRAAAGLLAAAGSGVVLTSRSLPEAEAAAADIGAIHGVPARAIACDVGDPDSVRGLFEDLAQWTSGRLDILICNAGYPFDKKLWDTPLHETPRQELACWYESVLRTDAMGSLFCTYEALPLMMAAKSGSIVFVSSTPALEGLQGTPYTVAKAAILGLMRDVACVYGRWNIRANALALGSILTPATLAVLDGEAQREFAEEAPLGRWGLPEEVAEAMLFLASPRSSFVTGQTLVVDGGVVRR